MFLLQSLIDTINENEGTEKNDRNPTLKRIEQRRKRLSLIIKIVFSSVFLTGELLCTPLKPMHRS